MSTIEDHVAENYRQLRAETGRTWDEMAEQFERDAEPLPAEHAAPYLRLADWARAQAEAEDTEDTAAEDAEAAAKAEAAKAEAEKAAAEAAAKAEAEKAAKAAKSA